MRSVKYYTFFTTPGMHAGVSDVSIHLGYLTEGNPTKFEVRLENFDTTHIVDTNSKVGTVL